VLGQGSHFFGPSLREKVKAFQTDYGLTADGVVSSETLMHITGLAETTAMALIYRKKGKDNVLHP
jgi:murein L,D-transpeptidase YcbB/YkuD